MSLFTQEEKSRPFGAYSCDETLVPEYTLPNPLLREDGSEITTASQWCNERRAKILGILKKYEYGEVLPRPDSLSFELLSQRGDALEDTAIRQEFRIRASMANGRSIAFDMLVYIPKNAAYPVPAFLGLNFKGNHTTTDEPDVGVTGPDAQDELPLAVAESHRGIQSGRWCFRETIAHGFASATICYHDIFRDEVGYAQTSVFSLFFDPVNMAEIGEEYTPIGAWAWGLSRGLECLESLSAIDPSRVVVHGHSRLGKTALWCGAIDNRFSAVVSNCSGCCGGALHRRKYGENLSQHFQSHLNWDVPCWFVNRLDGYIWREEELPFDQHELLALIAPRPLVIGTATEDLNADPKGEFLAAVAATKVYQLFGSKGLPCNEMPPPDREVTGDISFHCRSGGHDQTLKDWMHYFQILEKKSNDQP